jgi:DNA polymerase III subunit epsilon
MYLFFDTETTGLPDLKMPAEWEGQPRICQLGAIVTDRDGRVKAEANLLIRPDGWTIPEAASAVHGISQADAEKYGVTMKGALSVFARLMKMADTLIAHNLRFDLFLLEIEATRTDLSRFAFEFPKGCYCTMTGSTHVLQLPPTQKMQAAGFTKFKNPNLQEAYRHFFGREFEGAHDAMADVRACRDVFFALKKLEATQTTGAAA